MRDTHRTMDDPAEGSTPARAARRRERAAAFAVSFLLAALTFPACAAETGYLRYRMPDDPRSLDPHQALNENSLVYIVNLFDGLVEFEPGGLKVVPAVAESWDLSADNRSYTFHLRKGVRFHDGREVTAADVVFSLKRVLDPKAVSPLRPMLEGIEGAAEFAGGKVPDLRGVASPDSRTVVITLEHPSPLFLGALASQAGSIVPADIYSGPKESYLAHPVGCGPFKFEAWEHGVSITLAAFDGHWKGKPGIPGIKVRFIPDVSTALEEFKTGGLDFDNEVPAGQRDWVSVNLKESYKSWSRLATAYVGLNFDSGPLKGNAALRRAISCAVDRDRIARVLQEGKDVAATRLLPPGILGSDVAPGPYHYDPARAKRLLAEAGYPEGKGLAEMVFLVPSNEAIRRYSEAVQADLAAVGIKVRLKVLDFAAFNRALEGTKESGVAADLYPLLWFADYPDPDAIVGSLLDSKHFGSEGNYARYANPEVDRLLDAGRREVGTAKRETIYREVERIALDDAALVPIYFVGDDALVSPRLTGFRSSPLGDYAIPLELLRLTP